MNISKRPSNTQNLFAFDDTRLEDRIVGEPERLSVVREELFFPYSHEDLVLRQNEITEKSMIIRPLQNIFDNNDHLYRISPFMTSYCLLGIISNFIN